MAIRLLASVLALARSAAGRIGTWLVRWSGREESGQRDDRRDDASDEIDRSEAQPTAPTESDAENRARSTPQIVTTAISLLLIVLLAGAILYDGYAGNGTAPAGVEIDMVMEEVRRDGDAFYIPFEAHNTGDQTIEQVLIAFEVRDGEEIVEDTETVITLLGERGSVSGVLVLDRDPAGLEIEARVMTFLIAEE